MIRQTIIPTSNTYTLQLQIPDSMIGKKVEVYYDEEKEIIDTPKNVLAKNMIAYFKSISVDTTNIEKYNREDLYE